MKPVKRELRSIAVFCGSNFGDSDIFSSAAAKLGEEIAHRGIRLVYGGTNKGLMGVLADSALKHGGHVHGVITRRLSEKGHLHPSLSLSEILDSMKERKARMLALADASIALPGGIGTLEEFMETWTLNQLQEVDKPTGLLNVDGFYDPLLHLIDRMVERKFLPVAHRDELATHTDPGALIDMLANQRSISTPKWL